MKTKPVVFISNFHPFTTRNIFDTGVLSGIANLSEKVVAFVSLEKESYMKGIYEKGNISIIGVESSSMSNRVNVFFYNLAELFIDTKTKRDHQLKYLAASKKWYRTLKYYLAIFFIIFFGNLNFLKKFYRIIENVFHHPKYFSKYFDQYSPDIVFLTDIFAQADTLLAIEAKQRNVATKALVRSWDNTTNKSLLRVVPDSIIVQNLTMKKEMVGHHAVSDNKIRVVGVPQFEQYLKHIPKSREEFCHELGLDPSKKIILFSPGGSKYVLTDWQVCEILKKLQNEGKISQDIQFLVRLHPQNFTDLSHFKPNKNFVIDDPGVGLKVDRAKEFELGVKSVEHLADSLYHSILVLNVVSSLVVDAAIFDKPVITVAFNGWEKTVPYLKSVERVQAQEWLQALNNTGVAPSAHNPQELASLIEDAIKNPDKNKEARRLFIESHCNGFKGDASHHMIDAVLENYENR